MMKLKKNKVVLGLSGGVDSTAAALLLQEKGYEVVGLFFDIGKGGRERAETVAGQLGIEFIYKDVSKIFDELIVGNFCNEYACARTPNPCIVCNPLVKFKTFLDAADEVDAYYIATGHYADTYYDEASDLWFIKKAANERKDQSYMLYRLGQEAISRLILPLNEIDDKEKVRELAREKALVNAEAKDSQEICFIDADDNYKDFLRRRGITASKGDFIDSEGNVLGEHKGILDYTIGQRKGLGITLGKPAFVTKIDSANNQVTLGDNADLFNTEVYSSGNILLGEDIDLLGDVGLVGMNNIKAKIRYAAKPAEADIELLDNGRIKTVFKEAQRAATPGQSIVFYNGDLVIGGGFID